MKIQVSDAARAAMAAALAAAIDGGGSGATLVIYDGVITGKGKRLIALPLASPAAKADGATVTIGPVISGRATAGGAASWGQIIDGAGKAVLGFDIGENNALLCMNTTRIAKGGLVEVDSISFTVPE